MSGNKPISLDELYAILSAGGRNSGERSTAKPQRAYQDPAKHVQFERERKMKKVKRKGREK